MKPVFCSPKYHPEKTMLIRHVRSAGTVKNLPHYLRVKPAFRREGRKLVGKVSELGFMDLDSPSNTVRIQLATSKTNHISAGRMLAGRLCLCAGAPAPCFSGASMAKCDDHTLP